MDFKLITFCKSENLSIRLYFPSGKALEIDGVKKATTGSLSWSLNFTETLNSLVLV